MRTIALAGSCFAVLGLACGCSSDKETPTAAPATVTATVTVTATPTPTIDPATAEKACRDALRANYEDGWEKAGNDPYPPAARTPVCSALTRPVIERLMDEAVADIMNGTTGP